MTERLPHLDILENMDIPDAIEDVAHKLELYLVRGRFQQLHHFWGLVKEHYQNSELGLDHYEALHFRVARLALRNVRLSFMEMVLDEVPNKYQDHPQYVALRHFYNHFRMVELRQAFFPLNVPFDERENGPHLFEPPEDGRTITTWVAGRVDAVEDKIYTVIQHFTVGEDVGDAYFNIPFGTLEKWESSRPEDEVREGDYFEIVIYDGNDDEPHIKWWGREYEGWDALPLLRMDALRYLRRVGWVVGGQTFVEKCLRGEEESANIDDYVDRWHEGEPRHLSGWSLADYLGMVPEEYERWVEDPASLPEILNERAEIWREEGRWSDDWPQNFNKEHPNGINS